MQCCLYSQRCLAVFFLHKGKKGSRKCRRKAQENENKTLTVNHWFLLPLFNAGIKKFLIITRISKDKTFSWHRSVCGIKMKQHKIKQKKKKCCRKSNYIKPLKTAKLIENPNPSIHPSIQPSISLIFVINP